jgi:DNA-directed RNA polymerase subunit RPC12/RpoP
MGSDITIKCSNCQSVESFMLGEGFMYSSLKNVLNLVHHKRRRRISEILNNHDVLDTEYEHRLYRCPECNRLYGRFYVKIFYDGDRVYETNFQCATCRTPLEHVQNEMETASYPCAFCGQKSLSVIEGLLWD